MHKPGPLFLAPVAIPPIFILGNDPFYFTCTVGGKTLVRVPITSQSPRHPVPARVGRTLLSATSDFGSCSWFCSRPRAPLDPSEIQTAHTEGPRRRFCPLFPECQIGS